MSNEFDFGVQQRSNLDPAVQLPSDWEMPEEFQHLSPEDLELMSDLTWDHVPVPLMFRLGMEMGEKLGQLDDAESLTFIIEEIQGRLAEHEARYPKSGAWDRMRGGLIDKLLETGNFQFAINQFPTIQQPHLAAEKMLAIIAATDGLAERPLFDSLENMPEERKYAIVRAFRDNVIEHDPLADNISFLNYALQVAKIETDPINGWIESVRPQYPDFDWDSIKEQIADDDMWAGVPVTMRQHTMLRFAQQSLHIVREGVDDEYLAGLIEELDSLEDEFPVADMWSNLRGSLSSLILRKNDNHAIELAKTIRQNRYIVSTVLAFIKHEKEDSAIELALTISDPKMLAEVLVEGPWQDPEQPMLELASLLRDESCPIEKRIGLLEFLNEKARKQGQTGQTEALAGLLEDLKTKSAGED